MRDCPNAKGKEKIGQSSGSSDSRENNRFYALHSKGEQGTYPNVVTDMLKIFTLDVYALLDTGDTLSFVTPLVALLHL